MEQGRADMFKVMERPRRDSRMRTYARNRLADERIGQTPSTARTTFSTSPR
jgi:hypothetical protein